MSSFSFDFDVLSSDNTEENHESISELKEIPVEKNVIIDGGIIVECFQVVCPECNPEILDFRVHEIGDLIFKEVLKPYEETLHRLDEECDIIPGKYEGGFKIWECSYDLARVIADPSILQLSSKNILELGCGHGLPGIAAMMVYEDLNEIVFSDFNSEVLTDATWPNILLNCPNTILDSEKSVVKCMAGDWTSLSCSIKMFDLILSAETLYTVESCRKVFEMIETHLAPNGVALIASKKYYFGVGGGTFDLENLALSTKSKLKFSVVKSFEDGQSNIREVIKLMRK